MANRGFQLPCACGCGALTYGEYKRGHRRNPPVKDEYTPDDDGLGEWSPITIDDAAEMTPDDPHPAEEGEHRPLIAERPIRITKRIRDDVTGKLAFILTMVGTALSLTDPVCGGAFLDNADNVARKMAPLICKSPDMVKKLTKGSDYMMYVDVLMACMPIIIVISNHHFGTKRPIGTPVNPTMPPQYTDDSQFTAA